MAKSNKFLPEIRERAVRMVQSHCCDSPSLWGHCVYGFQIGCLPQTLNEWLKNAEVDSGQRADTTSRMRNASKSSNA